KPLKLKTTPYHVRYAQWLKPAAEHLRKAAAASDDKAFATYLRDRATALLTDDYYKSDVEWVELKDPKFDVIFAPYEVYADALLNDPRIHEKVGSKKIFFKNFMDARVNDIILPLAKRVMRPEDASIASAEGYLASTMMHEICHGLGPTFARVRGKREDIRS